MADDPTASFAELRRLATIRPADVLAEVRRIVATDPGDPEVHRIGALALRALGRIDHAEAAELAAIGAARRDPLLEQAARLVRDGDPGPAETILRTRIAATPDDVLALYLLADLKAQSGHLGRAEAYLRHAVALAPAFVPTRSLLANVLHKLGKPVEALRQLDELERRKSGDPTNARLRPAVLGRIGDYDGAIAFYERVLDRSPDKPELWMSYGHMLKTVGRSADAVAAYRRSIGLRPAFGEVWWSLANLKTVRFDDADVAAMTDALEETGVGDEDRLHLHFALGSAQEARQDRAASFRHYAAGNAIRRAGRPFDLATLRAVVARSRAVFTPDYFAARQGWGCPAEDAIFVLGMPRAGSTLIEQILASHSQVEGTQELPDLPALVRDAVGTIGRYPDALTGLDAAAIARIGESYLERTRIQRKSGRPFFIDKLPNNWLHVGFIKLILPNARIIDARRHPLASCFSNFRQHFATGQDFAYDLADLGHYYREYVTLMAHFDRVLPGAVHRVSYEAMVADTDAEIGRLLDAMRLPFEPQCLRFWETDRPVRTASSEQVRRPINRDGLDPWRPYARWLGPLEDALGDVVSAYPDVPYSLS